MVVGCRMYICAMPLVSFFFPGDRQVSHGATPQRSRSYIYVLHGSTGGWEGWKDNGMEEICSCYSLCCQGWASAAGGRVRRVFQRLLPWLQGGSAQSAWRPVPSSSPKKCTSPRPVLLSEFQITASLGSCLFSLIIILINYPILSISTMAALFLGGNI